MRWRVNVSLAANRAPLFGGGRERARAPRGARAVAVDSSLADGASTFVTDELPQQVATFPRSLLA
jgi:hypothetical protein